MDEKYNQRIRWKPLYASFRNSKIGSEGWCYQGHSVTSGRVEHGDNQWPSKVKGVYDNLINDLELNPDSVALLAGEVVNADQGGVCASMNSIIAKLPQTIHNSYVISSSGCTDTTDNLHFNAAGYRELGKRYATKMLSLLGIEPTDVQGMESFGIDGYELEQNYPNPFNPVTNIKFTLPQAEKVRLDVYNIIGEKVITLIDKDMEAGFHSIPFNAANLSTGTYIYRLQTRDFSQTKKMLLMK